MNRNLSITALTVASLWLLSTTAHAQTMRSGGDNASAQLMQQMQQVVAERTQLQADNAKLKKDLEDLKKQVKSLQSEKDALSHKAQNSEAALSHSTASNESLNQNLAQQRARMEELIGKFRETATTLRDVETERSTVKGQLATRDRELKSCVDKNLALYKINAEVLDRFEHQGFWSSLAKAEPFTRLKRTEIENLVDEYRNKADDQRVPGTTGAVGSTPGTENSSPPRS
jgi:cell division septum initiation protein DivIVA